MKERNSKLWETPHQFSPTSTSPRRKAIRRQVPDVALYVEMCHTTRMGPVVGVQAGYDNFSIRRTTPSQLYTTAHVAYARGLHGVRAFNFVHYREHGTGARGPFCEPPFDVFKHLGAPSSRSGRRSGGVGTS